MSLFSVIVVSESYITYMTNKGCDIILISCYIKVTTESKLSDAMAKHFFFFLWGFKYCSKWVELQALRNQRWAFTGCCQCLYQNLNLSSNRDILSPWMLTDVTEVWIRITHFQCFYASAWIINALSKWSNTNLKCSKVPDSILCFWWFVKAEFLLYWEIHSVRNLLFDHP